MIRQEYIMIGDRKLVKTWSDTGKYIIQVETGIKYHEAIDIPNQYTYTESTENIESEYPHD